MIRLRLAALLLSALALPVLAQDGDGKDRAVDAIYGAWSLDTDKFAEEMANAPEFQAMPEEDRKAQLESFKMLTAEFLFADGTLTVSGTMMSDEEKHEMTCKVVEKDGSHWVLEVKEADKEQPEKAVVEWLADDSIRFSIVGAEEGSEEVKVTFPLTKKS